MNNIIQYNFQNSEVRIVNEGEQLWFVAKDVCEAIGHVNTSVAIKRLDEDEKGIKKVYTINGEQDLLVVSEPGLYTLLVRSNKPLAKTFTRWITHEVLPQIRKTGSYSVQPVPAIDPTEHLLITMLEQHRSQKQLEKKVDRLIGEANLVVEKAQEAHTLAQAAVDIHSSNYGFYTVLGWARLKNIAMDHKLASIHGRKLSQICRTANRETSSVKDARWGQVKTYPEDVLKNYFADEKDICYLTENG